MTPLVVAIAAANAVAFLAIGFDKLLARAGRRRVPEAWLLLLAVPLAVPGAVSAMTLFRHKTVKTSFRVKMALVALLNVAGGVLWWRSRS